jgi:hypothetical protein
MVRIVDQTGVDCPAVLATIAISLDVIGLMDRQLPIPPIARKSVLDFLEFRINDVIAVAFLVFLPRSFFLRL